MIDQHPSAVPAAGDVAIPGALALREHTVRELGHDALKRQIVQDMERARARTQLPTLLAYNARQRGFTRPEASRT